MFSGIIQNIGSISNFDNGLTIIETNLNLKDCKLGSSISCNGVCLTAKDIKINQNGKHYFVVDIGEETLKRTNLSKCITDNSIINIEKSLKLGDEIGGHFVYGHVDTTTSIIEIKKLKNSWEYKFEKNFGKNNYFIAEKASIAINGISLTIANTTKNTFSVSIIEHTFNNTNLKKSNHGDIVNIEFDYLARFINKNEKQ